MDEYAVKVYIYDLSKGLARSMSMAFLGKQLDGIWHTGIVVFDQEFFYGGMGIESCAPGHTVLGQPDSIVEVGKSQIPFEMFMEYLEDLSKTSFKADRYHLLNHNCNTFSDDLAHFLTGNNIPSHITNLPQEVLNTPFGAMIKPFVDAMSVSPEGGHQLFPSAQGTATTAANSMPASAKSQNSSTHSSTSKISSAATGNSCSPISSTQKKDKNTSSNSNNSKVKIMSYTDDKIVTDFKTARSEFQKVLTPDDLGLVDEIHEYLSTADCSWGLGRQHLKVLGNCLRNKSLQGPEKCLVARLLQKLVMQEDNIALITHDPNNTLLSVLVEFENHSSSVQTSIVKVVCNFCQHKQGREWLESTAEKTLGGQTTSPASAVCKLCASSLLSDTPDLNTVAAALAQNLTCSKVTEENAIEIGIALIQLLSKDPPENTVLHSLHALSSCMQTNDEICGVATVMGLDMDSYKAKYPKLQDICLQITQQLSQAVE